MDKLRSLFSRSATTLTHHASSRAPSRYSAHPVLINLLRFIDPRRQARHSPQPGQLRSSMRRHALLALAAATTAAALEDWIHVWPWSGRQSRRLTNDLDCAPFDASHLVARPRRKRADCQIYEQPDKADDGLLCIGDRFKLDSEVSYCAEPYSPGSWYLAAKKGIDLGMGRRLGADPATFDYHPTNGY